MENEEPSQPLFSNFHWTYDRAKNYLWTQIRVRNTANYTVIIVWTHYQMVNEEQRVLDKFSQINTEFAVVKLNL